MRLLLLATFLFSSICVFAQLEYQHTLNMYNGFLYNPAVASSKPSASIVVITRNQWTGFEGAPKTSNLALTIPITKFNAGVGFYLLTDKIGNFNRTSINTALAYALKLQNLKKLSFGLSSTFNTLSLDPTRFKFIDASDPGIAGKSSFNQSSISTNFGVLYTSNSLYAGLSILNLTSNASQTTSGYLAGYPSLIILSTGFNVRLNDNLELRPSIFLKASSNSLVGTSIDVNSLLLIRDRYITGLTYRHQDALCAVLGYAISSNLKLVYAYDYSINKLNSVNNGSHEILIGYDWPLNTARINTNIIKSPRFL